jgi:hypothetical protein
LIALLMLAAIAFVGWMLIAPGERFLSGFTRLLDDSRIERGLFSLLSGRSYAVGRFRGRDAAFRMQVKRSRYGQGYLVVALRASGPPTLSYDAVEAQTRDQGGRRALVTLAGHDLVLNVEEGWLKALWRPQGFVIFPGSFSAEKWRQVLEAMHAVALSLEAAGSPLSPETGADS